MTSANSAKEYLGNTNNKPNRFQRLDKLAYTKPPFLPPLYPAMRANKRGKSSFVKLNSMFLTQPLKNKLKGPLKLLF